MTPIFSLIIPCYNEENAIEMTVDQLGQVLPSVSYQVIVVNDGSSDRTSEKLAALSMKYDWLTVVHHEFNLGYGAALKTGIMKSTADFIVITDADGTYPNERIGELLEVAASCDMVVGARIADDVTYPLIRKIPKWFLGAFVSWITGKKIPDMNSGLRVMRRDALIRFLSILPSGFSFTTTITLAMVTNSYDVQYVPIGYKQRIGNSKIRPIRDTLNFVQLIVRSGVYFAPLRVFLPVGLTLSFAFLASVSYDVFVLRNLTDKSVLFLLFAMNTVMFALLADMIHKRT